MGAGTSKPTGAAPFRRAARGLGPLIQINATAPRGGFYCRHRQQEGVVISYDIDSEKWAQVAAECRRLAGLARLDWMRGELLRSAQFYDNLSTGFGRNGSLARGSAAGTGVAS